MSFARPDALVSIKEKKRRIDVDLKTAVTLDAVREKKARTAGGYAEANDLCPRRAANQWQDVISGQYRASTMMSFDHSSIVSIAFDASRVGQPKEDTVTYAIADCRRHIGAWLPPSGSLSLKTINGCQCVLLLSRTHPLLTDKLADSAGFPGGSGCSDTRNHVAPA